MVLAFVVFFLVIVVSHSEKPPHVVLVVVDDLGYADVSYNGHGNIKTPHIDKLSEEGIRMSNYYVHPICTPSRAALMTGRYSQNVGLSQVLLGPSPFGLDDKYPTFPQELKKRNYSTHMVGKWHLGHSRWKYTPTGKGFDSFVGLFNGAAGHYSKHLSGPNPYNGWYDWIRAFSNGTYEHYLDDDHSTKVITKEAINTMEAHKNNHPDKPLFLYVAYTAPHTPLQAEPEWLQKCQHLPHQARRAYCGLVVGVDEAIANLSAAVTEYLGYNTVIIFSTDNGGHPHVGGINTPLRGAKITSWEGGCHGISFVVDRSQKYLGSGNRNFTGLAHISDWMPTILSIVERTSPTKSPPPSNLDGHDLSSAIHANSPSPRQDVVLHMSKQGSSISYRRGPWKLILGHAGDSDWSEEPQEWVVPHADFLDKMYEVVVTFIENRITRDNAFFWKEIVHALVVAARNTLWKSDDHSLLSNTILFNYNETISITPPMYPHLFNIEEDPNEKTDQFQDKPEIVQDLLEHVNRHWMAQPEQYDTHFACVSHKRPLLPLEVCSHRTSHLYKEIERWSVSNMVECVFEHPWVSEGDTNLCGDGTGVNAIQLFLRIIKIVFFIILLVFVIILGLSCCIIYKCVRKSTKITPPKLKKD